MASKIRSLIDMSPGWSKIYDENKKFASRMGMRHRNHGIMVFPDLMSDSPSMLKFRKELHTALQASEWQAHGGELSQNSLITGSWDALLSVAGYVMAPTANGMESNDHLIKDLKLPRGFLKPEHLVIMRELAHVMFGEAKLSSMSFKKSSSSGFPYFSADVLLKEKLWEHGSAVLLANLGKSLKPTEFLKYSVPTFYITGARTQPEGLKPRFVWDGYQFVPSDKSTPFDGFHTMRHRLVYAGAGAANYAINGVFTSIRASYYSRLEKTYKVRFPQDIVDRFEKFSSLITVDVSNYDTTIQDWMFDALLKILVEEELFDPVFVSLLRSMLGGPSASQSPYPLEMSKQWPTVGDPYDDATYTMTKGLMSGIAVVSDFGRFFMTWNLLSMLNDVTGDVIGNVDRYLKHQMPLAAFSNSSDDNFIGCVTEELMTKWLGTRDKPRATYFDVRAEDYLVYLGTQYYRQNGRLHHVPNLQSWLVKWQCPEHSISLDGKGNNRRYWKDGWFGRNSLYDYHPQFRDLYQLTDSVFKKHHSMSLRDTVLQGTQAPDVSYTLTEADKIYLDNPDSIHYKIDINDVSPELLKADYGQIKVERIEKVLRKLVGRNMEITK